MTLIAVQVQSAPSDKSNNLFITLVVEDSSGGGIQSDVAHAIRNYADFYLNHIGIPHSATLLLSTDTNSFVISLDPEAPTKRIFAIPTVTFDEDSTRANSDTSQKMSFQRAELNLTMQTITCGGRITLDSTIIGESFRKDQSTEYGDTTWSSESTTEPTEFVIQRTVERIFKGIDPQSIKHAPVALPIAATMYVDASFMVNHQSNWLLEIERMTDVVSRSLLRQFGRSLEQDQIIMSHADPGSLRQNFDALKRLSGPSDTLNILLMEQRTPLEYYSGRVSDELGMTDLGGSRIAIDCIPPMAQKSDIWFPFANGLTLLHEIGHAYGAIHVFDHRSIMCHRLHWTGTDSFDVLNTSIMREVMFGQVDALKPVEYVALVSRALRDSHYPYADFPDFFWRYLAGARTSVELDSLAKAIDCEPYVISADAMNLLQTGDRAGAVRRWKRALELEPDQPVLLYYLALSSSGADSVNAMTRSIELGLYPSLATDQFTTTRPPH